MRREEGTRPGQFKNKAQLVSGQHEACRRGRNERETFRVFMRSFLKPTPYKKVKKKTSGLLLNAETTSLPLLFPRAVIIGLGNAATASSPANVQIKSRLQTSSCV